MHNGLVDRAALPGGRQGHQAVAGCQDSKPGKQRQRNT
eukprot:CAMPEP_0168427490 /NCGR_PEP_ID=MMETSP0228-20121227/36375_1 /TAXON_ID=133427 /ORGANISM="Protoceratium reticulatum, Strain CCCM 535 (=CCMP 1889)" /LENGTH=37 /DNA_ID= /DNA_START= /DNA_END= /DNA_ORIENTATION=